LLMQQEAARMETKRAMRKRDEAVKQQARDAKGRWIRQNTQPTFQGSGSLLGLLDALNRKEDLAPGFDRTRFFLHDKKDKNVLSAVSY
jgi:hypothetical protein